MIIVIVVCALFVFCSPDFIRVIKEGGQIKEVAMAGRQQVVFSIIMFSCILLWFYGL
jgi:hypothetical protein